MSQYKNRVDITSGRRLHVASPIDDRLVFLNESDILQDIDDDRAPAWYDGLFAYIKDKHNIYIWLDANANNPFVPYDRALLSSNYMYSVSYPDPIYAGKSYNWYPLPAGFGGFFNNEEPTSATNLEGWPEGTIPGGPRDIQYMWDKLLYPYVPPLISLAKDPSAVYYEKGVIINPTQLRATTTKKKLPITSIEFFRDGISIFLNNSPSSTGGLEIYTDVVNVGPTQDVEYQAVVSDNQIEVHSNKVQFKFVYPFYIGNTAISTPNETTVKALTKVVTPKQNQQYIFNFSQQRYVIAYPQAYGQLDHIYDTNRFETIDDYTILTDTYTMLDGASVPYYIYVFNFLTDAVDFTNYFEF